MCKRSAGRPIHSPARDVIVIVGRPSPRRSDGRDRILDEPSQQTLVDRAMLGRRRPTDQLTTDRPSDRRTAHRPSRVNIDWQFSRFLSTKLANGSAAIRPRWSVYWLVADARWERYDVAVEGNRRKSLRRKGGWVNTKRPRCDSGHHQDVHSRQAYIPSVHPSIHPWLIYVAQDWRSDAGLHCHRCCSCRCCRWHSTASKMKNWSPTALSVALILKILLSSVDGIYIYICGSQFVLTIMA